MTTISLVDRMAAKKVIHKNTGAALAAEIRALLAACEYDAPGTHTEDAERLRQAAPRLLRAAAEELDDQPADPAGS